MDPNLQTGKKLTLIAIILQVVLVIYGLIGIVFLVSGKIYETSHFECITRYSNGTTQITASSSTVYINPNPILLLFFLIPVLIILVMIFLEYYLVYKPISKEKSERGKTPSLVLGIVQLFAGGIEAGMDLINIHLLVLAIIVLFADGPIVYIIVGILLILAYVKINDAINRKKYESLNQQNNTDLSKIEEKRKT